MEIKLQKWGNSLGIRIPQAILKSLNVKANDLLCINQEDDKIIIRIPKKKKISLKEEFKKYNGKNLSKDFTWDESVGKRYGKEIYS